MHTERGLNFANAFNAGNFINEAEANKPIHISISRMGRRVQVFANEEKVLDLTAAFQKDVKLTSARFFVNNATDADNYYLSNIRYAIGQPDTRSKLLESGTYSTSAITFNSGSAEIKPYYLDSNGKKYWSNLKLKAIDPTTYWAPYKEYTLRQEVGEKLISQSLLKYIELAKPCY